MVTPLLVTAALVIKEDSILLLKNGRGPFKDYWGFPGGIGGWESTSDPLEAIIEEIQGDVGCRFSGDFFTLNYSNQYLPSFSPRFFIKNFFHSSSLCLVSSSESNLTRSAIIKIPSSFKAP